MNSFVCPKCNKRTKHVKLGFREGSAQRGDWSVAQGASAVIDITGIGNIYSKLTGQNFWKCCDCGLVHVRNSRGDIIDEQDY